MTAAASVALAALLESPEVPDGAVPDGRGDMAPTAKPAVGLTLVSEPDPGDEVIAVGEGVDVFVGPQAAGALEISSSTSRWTASASRSACAVRR